MVSGPVFAHDEPGTSVEAWTRALAEHPLPDLELPDRVARLVVVGAHPDDETLGAGGLVQRAHRAGWEVEVVSASAGERSHPASASHSVEALAGRRRDELAAAVAHLAPSARVTCLGLPDGELSTHVDGLVDHLVQLIGMRGDVTVVAATWRGDGHPDHEAVGRAAALAARRTDARLLEYPVWLWHWGSERDLPWSQARQVRLGPDERGAKRAAVAAHASQVEPLTELPGDEALLSPEVLAHFERGVEVVFEAGPPTEDDALDRVHRDRSDPWQVDSFYERRKRAITLGSLPRERYRQVLEVGCSVGALAEDLASRCDALLAVDSSVTALEAARRRLAAVAHADVRRAEVPLQWPTGRFDLVSISEVGYFLSPHQLHDLVPRAFEALAPEGHLLLCHWRHDLVGWPLTGPRVHDAFLATGAQVLVEHQDADFVLHVLGGAR